MVTASYYLNESHHVKCETLSFLHSDTALYCYKNKTPPVQWQ